MNARQLASRTAAVVVGGIAAVASFDHMRTLAVANGQTHLIGTLMPVSVDGMILVATLAIADGRTRKGSAWVAFLIGVAASVTANVLAAPDTVLARCISGWPAVALLLVVEVLTRGGRAAEVPADDVEIEAPDTVETPEREPVADVKPAAGGGPKTRAPRRDSNAERVAKAAARMPGASPAEIAAKLKLSESTVRRYLPADKPAPGSSSPAVDEISSAAYFDELEAAELADMEADRIGVPA